MKKNILYKVLPFLLISITVSAQQSYSPPSPSDGNYVLTRTYQEEKNSSADIVLESDVVETISYFDGLGREQQAIGIGQSPNRADMVTPYQYDRFGRMSREWLPYPSTDVGRGSYKPAETFGAQEYYENTYPIDFTGLSTANINAYSEKTFETSPLNRVTKQAAPGKDWKKGNDHEINIEYYANSTEDAVKRFDVTLSFADNTYAPTIVPQANYTAGELYKSITKDENHSGTTKNYTTEEFTDKQGRVVLKRTYNNAEPHDTYYVYDDFGNLTYVLPPKVDTSDDISTTELNELCYQYTYDHRNRLVEKKIPGKGWEYIVYNKLDQPILTQDANQRAKSTTTNEWLFTKYDAFGRVAYTGIATSAKAATRADIQAEVDAITTSLWVVQTGSTTSTSFGDTATIHYNDGAFPTATPSSATSTTLTEVLTINYYDSYVNVPTGAPSVISILGSSPAEDRAQNVKSLATVSRVRVLDQSTEKWINTLTYYDHKARPVYTYSANEYLGTTDIIETQLDFVGKPLKTKSTHIKNGNTIVTIDNFTYDHVGRLLSQTQCVGDASLGDTCPTSGGNSVPANLSLTGTISTAQIASQSITFTEGTLTNGAHLYIGSESSGEEELIVYNAYDELGQLMAKKVGGAKGTAYDTTSGLQTVDYTYNVRGWLKTINEDAHADNDLFNFSIRYNDPTNFGATENPTPLYNGNISQTLWSSQSTNTINTPSERYSYGYDALNRITGAVDNTGNYNVSGISYDKNGNIETLTRMGHTSPAASNFGLMDNLSYAYDSGNKLTNVIDNNASDDTGFIDVNGSGVEYIYDANGNMISDANKGITGIAYNHLNLPTEVAINNNEGNGTISYIYDATGVKLQKNVLENGEITPKPTDYAGNYIYENGTLQFFNHPEGYVNAAGGTYAYIYQYKDHLGNVRLSYTDNNDDGEIKVEDDEILEENNYYPFGLQHKGYNNVVTSTNPAQNYKYNGKELNDELGLDWYDYGARSFDPTLGRFLQVDMAAGVMRQYSPYVYAFNSPQMFVDRDGNIPTLSGGTDPIKNLNSGKKVDMNGAPKSSKRNAKGFKRNGQWFWRQQLKSNPEMFSKTNKYLIRRGRSPEVDSKWVEFNPSHKAYIKDKLVHHHIDQGRFATGIPDQAHKAHTKELHPRTGKAAKGFFRKSMRVMNSLGAVLGVIDFLSSDPHGTRQTMAQITGTQEIGQLYAAEDRNGDFSYQEVTQKDSDGDEDGVVMRVDVYEDYWYNEESGNYEGKGYIGYYSLGKKGLISTNIPGLQDNN